MNFQIPIISITILLLTSCEPVKKEKSEQFPEQKVTTGWVPAAEYNPKNPKASVLNDSAAALQIRVMQDPTLSADERVEMIEVAYSLLKEALKLDPEYRLAMTNLSAIYLEKRDTNRALELMQRRLELEPDMAEGWQAVGVFTDLKGDSAKAKTYYQKSIEIFDNRLKMGKKYAVREDLLYYYDNWSGKAFSLLLSGKTTEAHSSIKALLEEAGVALGQEAETYAAMLKKDRWGLLTEMKGN